MAKGGSTTTVTSDPLIRPLQKTIIERGNTAFNQVPAYAFRGQRVADYNTNLKRSQAGLEELGRGYRGAGNATTQLAQDTIEGKYLDPKSHPYLNDWIAAAIDPNYRRFENTTLPLLRSQASQLGAFGDPRYDLFSAENARNVYEAGLNTSRQMVGENFLRERANQIMAPQMLGQGAALNALSPQFFGQAGNMQYGQQQKEIEGRRQSHAENQTAPFIGLNQLGNLTNSLNPGSSTQVSQGGAGDVGNILSGVLGAASLALPFIAPAAAPITAALSSVGPYLSGYGGQQAFNPSAFAMPQQGPSPLGPGNYQSPWQF